MNSAKILLAITVLMTGIVISSESAVAEAPQPSKETVKAIRGAIIDSTWLKENDDELFAFDAMAVISNARREQGTWRVINDRTIVAQMTGFYAITFDCDFEKATLFGRNGLTMAIHRKPRDKP